MKQSIGLKAAVKAIQNRYKVKEGLARRLARAEAEVIKKVYPSISKLSADEILEKRYASPEVGVNLLRDLHVAMIVPVIKGTKEAQVYQATAREVIVNSDASAEEKEEIIQSFDSAIDRPDAAEVEKMRARMKELLSKVKEVAEEFEKFEQGLITKEDLYEFIDTNEMVRYRLMTGDYGEEAEAAELAAGEPTYERWFKERGGNRR